MGILRAKTTLGDRVKALGDAATLSFGRSDADIVTEAQRVVAQADRRLAFAGDVTVIAVGGATGSGKSSLFNALSGTQLAEPGVKRPTTSKAMAAFWGTQVPADLLDWLEIPRRHVIDDPKSGLGGLVLIDLPDHDSIEMAHRLEVDRLVKLVDGLIWVVDPQKYADNALHERYLKPYADYADVMMVVLNQADRLTEPQLAQAMKDLRKLLDSQGLGRAHTAATSAATGYGIADLRKQVARMVKNKQAAADRLSADVTRAAKALDANLGDGKINEIPNSRQRQLEKTLADAAGVPIVKDAVRQATRRRGTLATGWPLVSWLQRFKPDPLKRLHLDRFTGKSKAPELEPVRVGRTSLPTGGGVQQARVDSALRGLADDASAGLPLGWANAVRDATLSHAKTLPDELDSAIATTDLAMDRGHGWWTFIRVLQWLLIIVVVAGLLWLTSGVVLAYFQLPPLPGYTYRNIPLPTWMVGGGVVAGLLLGLFSRIGVELTARAKAALAENALLKSIGEVAETAVVGPVDRELQRYAAANELVAKAIA